ncbi:hypothetical protein AMECASPLE_002299 [Ameca splendens]|uniref:Uncharacterized protein n=1 Tax=Ameca splendens TaxID=208324 RepID=A0ABV0XY23_9TELE
MHGSKHISFVPPQLLRTHEGLPDYSLQLPVCSMRSKCHQITVKSCICKLWSCCGAAVDLHTFKWVTGEPVPISSGLHPEQVASPM